MFSCRKKSVSNISWIFLREKYLVLKFLDVFPRKNTCFQYFLNFSPGKIPDAKIFFIFLVEKYLLPKFLDVFSGKNARFQYFLIFFCSKIGNQKNNSCFTDSKYTFPKFTVKPYVEREDTVY